MCRLIAPVSVLLVLLGLLLTSTDSVGADATCNVPPVNLDSAPSEDGTAVVLTWEASPDCTPDEYAVYRRDMDVEGARMVKIDTVDGSAPTYTDSSVNAGEHYRYRIRSNDQGSRSGRTDITLPEAAVTEPDPEPDPEPEQERQPGERSIGPRDGIKPVIQVANLDGTSLVIIFSELLRETPLPPASDFTVTIGTTDYTPSSVAIRGAEVELTLSTAAAMGDTVTLEYTPGTNAVADLSDNSTLEIENYGVKNHTGATNNRPAFSSESTTVTVDENSASGTNVGSPITATDADTGDSLTYHLPSLYTDFTVDSATGQIKTSVALDFEGGTTTYVLPLYVRDGKSPTGVGDSIFDDSIKVTITVNDVNEPPDITTTGTSHTAISMNEGTSPSLTLADYNADDPEGNTLTWSLSGADAALFTINNNGHLKTQALRDYEVPEDSGADNVYNLVVEVKDSSGSAVDDMIDVVVTVTNIDEVGSVTLPGTITSGLPATATLSDPDGSLSGITWQWMRGETASGTFTNISGATSNPYTPVAADAGKFLKAMASYTDGHGSGKSETSPASSRVLAGNEDPSFSSTMATRSVAENVTTVTNVGAPVSATDGDNDTLTYTLTGTDASSFTIDSTSGQIQTKSGTTYNYESKSSYSVTVNVRDSKDDAGNADTMTDDTIAVTINLTNVDEPGTVTISGTESGSETLTASVADIDGTVSSLTWQWARGNSASGPFTNIPGATSASYVTVALDVTRYLRATASYTDPQGAGKSANAVSGQIAASNAEPEFPSSETGARSVPENSPAGTNVGAPVAATDDDSGDTLFYRLGGTDASSFTIDSATGQIKTRSGVTYNFEGKNQYGMSVDVRDSKDAAGNANTTFDESINVVISLTDVNEAPTITTTATTASQAENTPTTTGIITFAAADVDASTTLTWSVEPADDGGKFDISSGGVLTFKASPNFEMPTDVGIDNVYNLTVKVTDDGSPAMSDTHAFAVTVTNVNEAPVITSTGSSHTDPDFTEIEYDADDQGLTVDLVVATYTASDVDADDTGANWTWSLSGNDAGDFMITRNADGEGVLSFKERPDYENPVDANMMNDYDITVKVRDDGGLEDTLEVEVNVENINERPKIIGDPGLLKNEIPFDLTDAEVTTQDLLTLFDYEATDEENDTITWSISAAPTDTVSVTHLEIDATTGVLSFKSTSRPDYENPVDGGSNNQYDFLLRATDDDAGDPRHMEIEVSIFVRNVDETPEFTAGDTTPSFAEIEFDVPAGDPVDLEVETYEARDEEMETPSFSISGTDAADFSINSATGVLSFKQRPNYEAPVDADEDNAYEITLTVMDGSGSNPNTNNTRSQPITITVTPVDETPIFTAPNSAWHTNEIEYDSGTTADDLSSIPATVANQAYWYRFEARDEEGQDITFTLSGDDAAYFVIDEDPDFVPTADADERAIARWAIVPDAENPLGSSTIGPQAYVFTVIASDGANTREHEAFIRVDDVNEKPSFTGNPGATLSYDENDTATAATYAAYDEEGGVTWTLTGADSADFTIDSGGTVTFVNTPDWEDPHDANGDNVYEYTVVATDIQSMTNRRTADHPVTLTVRDVEEPGTITVDNLNPAAGDVVTFTISDPDGGIVSEIGGPGSQGFSWSIQTREPLGAWQEQRNENTALATRPLEYPYTVDEDDTGREIRAVVNPYTDRRGSGKTVESEATAAVTADPIVNAPPRLRTGTSQSIPETDAGEEFGEPLTATDRDNDTVTWGIGTGGDSANFEINPSTGQLRTVNGLDFETTIGFLLVHVTLSDGRDADGNVESTPTVDITGTVSITILDVEEDGVVTLSEPEPGVGTTIQATLSDGDGSITGRSWQWARSTNGLTGWSNISGATSSSYQTVLADAGFFLRAVVTYTDNRGGGKRAEAITGLRVFGENQQPLFPSTESGERSVAENSSAGTSIGAPVSAEDPENNPLTYSLSGTDAASFSIIAGTGQLRVKEPLDFETKPSYEVTVDVHDGKDGLGNASATIDDSIDVTITVTNEDEPGTVTLTTLTATIQARVEVTAVLEDDDGPSSVTWAWARSPNGRTDWVNLLGATSSTYTPTLVDAGNFIRATATYNDGHGDNKTASKVSPRVGDPPPVNSAPAFPATEDGKREAPEDLSGGDIIGDPVAANDVNFDSLTYSLSGTDAASFEVDANSGQLRLASGVSLDFEGKKSYRVTVSVSDGADQNDDADDVIDDTINVVISVTNVNEAPVLSGDTSPSIAENSSAAIATYTAADPERDTLEWTVNSNAFWISSRGQLHFATPPDFEGGNTSFSIRVTATDPDGLDGSLDVTVAVTDVEEAGVLTLSPPRGWPGTRFDTRLSDDDGSTSGLVWRWARSSNRSSWQDIAGATGSSYTAGADDIGSYLRATVAYSDRRGSNKTASAVLDARIGESRPSSNTAPAFAEAEVPRSVGQGPGAGRSVGAPVKATDSDSDDVLTYTLSGPDADNFEIDPETGQIRTKAVLDPDVQETHNVTVEVHDGFNANYGPSDSPDDSVDVIITVARVSTAIFGGGFGGGGGGGGGPSGPTPSSVDFEWNVKRDIDSLASGHDSPTGAWSNGATFWLLENGSGADDAIYAYDLATGERVEDREFPLDERNRAPRGTWSDGIIIWVSDSGRDTLFAYDLATGERLPERDIELAERNRDVRGIWSDGTTMWVLNRNPSLYAYDLASGEFLASYALDSRNGDPHGLWSDGTTVWVSDAGASPRRLFAYRLPTVPAQGEALPEEPPALERVREEEFEELSDASNNSPRGIWSDGDVIYVADESDGRVYTYNIPDAIGARLASLSLEGIDIGEFDPGRTDYEGSVGEGVTATTVTAEAVQRRTGIAIDPPDADGNDRNGHQVALEGVTEIAVTVTSADGSRMKVYRVSLGAEIALSPGWNTVAWRGADGVPVAEAGIPEEVVVIYAWDETTRRWLGYFPGLEGVPGLNTLTVFSSGATYWVAASETVAWTPGGTEADAE